MEPLARIELASADYRSADLPFNGRPGSLSLPVWDRRLQRLSNRFNPYPGLTFSVHEVTQSNDTPVTTGRQGVFLCNVGFRERGSGIWDRPIRTPRPIQLLAVLFAVDSCLQGGIPTAAGISRYSFNVDPESEVRGARRYPLN